MRVMLLSVLSGPNMNDEVDNVFSSLTTSLWILSRIGLWSWEGSRRGPRSCFPFLFKKCLCVFYVYFLLLLWQCHDQRQLVEEMIISSYSLQPIMEGSQGRKSRKESGGRKWCRDQGLLLTGFLALHGSPNLLFKHHLCTLKQLLRGTTLVC